MKEYEISGIKYRIDDLPNFPAFHVARKLLPLLAGFDGIGTVQQELATLFIAKETPPSMEEIAGKLATTLTAMQPLLELISAMSEADSEFVLKTCLSHVYREDDKSSIPVFNAKAQRFQFQLKLPDMMLLAWQSIQENLASFFPEKASDS